MVPMCYVQEAKVPGCQQYCRVRSWQLKGLLLLTIHCELLGKLLLSLAHGAEFKAKAKGI